MDQVYIRIIICLSIYKNIFIIGPFVNFQVRTNKVFLVTKDLEMGTIPRCCYEGLRLTRLDQILNEKKIGISRIRHTDYQQSIIDGKLRIEPCPLANGDLKIAETMFGLCINIWSFTLVNKNEEWKQLRKGASGNHKIVINLHRAVDN